MQRLIVLSGLLLLAACGGEKSSSHVPDGKALFESSCSICHGKDGKLGKGGAKDLSVSELSLGDRIKIIEYGKPGMTPFKGVLRDDEIRAIAEYLDVLKQP